jgi:hypothetical protein
MYQFGWSVGHPTYLEDFLSVQTPEFGASFKVAESLKCWSRSCVAVLAPSSGKTNVGYPTEAWRGYTVTIFRETRMSRVPVSRIWERFWAVILVS